LTYRDHVNAIPGASVPVLNQDTFVLRSTKTDSVCAYQILALLAGPGFYSSSPVVTWGAIKSYVQDSSQGRYYTRYKSAEFYLQDNWRLTPYLTINTGFRASFFGA
jgi:hypothetical protein